MPRSKRKANTRGSAPEPDFAKKKPRLGGRAKGSNLTSTSFKSRQVHVPAQGRAATAVDKSGLTLVELLQRARHYNASTRIAALNGLTRAVHDERAAAYVQAQAQLGTVLATGLDTLCDDTPTVRKAGRETAVLCASRIRSVGPFAKLMAATLNAGLSHVRTELKVDSARAAVEILEAAQVPAEDMFGLEAGNPMEALKELLGVVKGAKGRVVVVQAVAALCGGRLKRPEDRKEQTLEKTGGKGRTFYYHQRRANGKGPRLGREADNTGLLSRMSGEDAGELLARITYLGMECLPIAECAKDPGRRELLTATAVALGAVTCKHSLSSSLAKSGLERMLKKWREERRRGGRSGKVIAAAERALASAALKCGEVEIAGEYLKQALKEKRMGADEEREMDMLVRGYLEWGKEGEEVGGMWLEMFEEKGVRGDEDWVKGRVISVEAVLGALSESKRGWGVERIVKVGMELGRREKWEGARAVMRVAGLELRRREMDGGMRKGIGEMLCKLVEDGVGLDDTELGARIGECIFYGGVGTDMRVLRGMVVCYGRGAGGSAGVAAGVDAEVDTGSGGTKLDAVAALRAVRGGAGERMG